MLTDLSYSYDKFGKIKTIEGNEQQWWFTYDSKSQLLTYKDLIHKNETEILYDKIYNRKSIKTSSNQIFYEINSMNQIVKAGDEIFSYDKNGNMINIK